MDLPFLQLLKIKLRYPSKKQLQKDLGVGMARGNSTDFNIQVRQDDHNNLSWLSDLFTQLCREMITDHCQICIHGLEKGMNEQLLF